LSEQRLVRFAFPEKLFLEKGRVFRHVAQLVDLWM
jgi:hypothetical protein